VRSAAAAEPSPVVFSMIVFCTLYAVC